jgi:hypothetical protein
MTSPFAAATQSYGDQRCGFATDSIDHQQQQQQQQQLAVPSVQQAELLLQQLPAGGQDAGAADGQQLQEWRQRWNAVSPSVAGLEQLASAATMQYLDAQGGHALALAGFGDVMQLLRRHAEEGILLLRGQLSWPGLWGRHNCSCICFARASSMQVNNTTACISQHAYVAK